jgi:hypothetical protein
MQCLLPATTQSAIQAASTAGTPWPAKCKYYEPTAAVEICRQGAAARCCTLPTTAACALALTEGRMVTLSTRTHTRFLRRPCWLQGSRSSSTQVHTGISLPAPHCTAARSPHQYPAAGSPSHHTGSPRHQRCTAPTYAAAGYAPTSLGYSQSLPSPCIQPG